MKKRTKPILSKSQLDALAAEPNLDALAAEPNLGELPATITGPALEKLTGLTSRRLRQLATTGKFPEPKRDRWQTVACVRGVFDYYRAGTDEIRKAKLDKLLAETRLLDQTHQEREGSLVDYDLALENLRRGHGAMTACVMAMTDLDIDHRETIINKIREAAEAFLEFQKKSANETPHPKNPQALA